MGGYSRPVPLVGAHEVAAFDCGSAALTEWLRRHALAAHRAGSSRVYVTCAAGTQPVAGYYAVTAGGVAHEDASARMKQGLGRYPVPVIVLTRLAVDIGHQGGLGAALLTDALRRVEQAGEEIGVRGIALNAESQTAKAFYLSYAAFEESPTDPLHLLLLMKDLHAAVRAANERTGDAGAGDGPTSDR